MIAPAARLASLAIATQAAAIGATVISSDFESGLDGWTKAPGSDSGSTLTWVTAGGNPGGFLRVNEAAQGNIDRIAAPEKFLGDKSAFVGGTFSMDRQTNTMNNALVANDDIRLIGDGVVLRYDLPAPEVDQWTTVTVELSADAGWLRVSDSQPPTPAQFLAVMSDLTAIQLLADFRSGPETPAFDNIIMTIPEPSTATGLLSFALIGCLIRRRR